MKLLAGTILILLMSARSYAQKVKISSVTVDPNDRTHIIVDLDNPAPPASAVNDKTFWLLYERIGKTAKKLTVSNVDITSLTSGTELKIDLYVGEQLPSDSSLQELDIVLANQTDFITVPPVTDPASLAIVPSGGGGSFVKPKGRTDSDVYFTGSYTGVQDGAPVYDIDAFSGYMHAIQSMRRSFGSIGFYGQVRTKSSAVVDPNSFLTYLAYQTVLGDGWYPRKPKRGIVQAPIFSLRAFGAEFDRSATQLNLVSSPLLTIPIRPISPPDHLTSKIATWPQLNLNFGTEFVYVKKSILAPTGGWHTRGLLGASLAAGYSPKSKYMDSLQFSSSWQVRLPSAPEIFYDSRFAPIDPTTGLPNTKKIPPMLGTQPRHNIDSKITYNYSTYGGITFEHTYGSLPPTFLKTNQSFAIGLTLAIQMKGFGRYAILRP